MGDEVSAGHRRDATPAAARDGALEVPAVDGPLEMPAGGGPLEVEVPPGHEGERLDRVLARLFAQFSRARLQRWVRAGHVSVNDVPCLDTRSRMYGGERVRISPPLDPVRAPAAQARALDLIYRDEHLLVLDKPAGLVVHPGAGNPDGTLVNALLHLDPGLAALPRAGLVHRLDKDTTGLMVVACTLESHTALVRMLARRDVQRRYEAVVHGLAPVSGTVDAPVGRHRQVRTRMSVTASGRSARTHYRRLASFRAHTHLAVELETGRTHQIRVHLSSLSHPIVGDRDYGGVRPPPLSLDAAAGTAVSGFPRQALHARHLAFTHPVSGEALAFSTPLPHDMAALVQALTEDAARDDTQSDA